MRYRRGLAAVALVGLAGMVMMTVASLPAGATTVTDEATFRTAWSNAAETQIDLAADITLTCGGGGFASRTSATALTVNGNGHSITQTCANNIVLNSSGAGALTFHDVTITGGNAPNTVGGGLFSTGSVTMTSSTVTGNTGTNAGGVASNHDLTIIDSTFSDNHAVGANGTGGGILAGGTTTIVNSTVSGNTAAKMGGGIAAGDVKLVYATVAGNSAPTGANIEIQVVDSLDPFASVIALPLGGGLDCDFSAPKVTNSTGFNFSDDSSCGLTAATDKQSAGDPGLGPLADNGGPTQTRLPQPGSPLIDAVPPASCQSDGATGITTDQRGLPRPAGNGCDTGAVEVQAAVVVVAAAPRFTG